MGTGNDGNDGHDGKKGKDGVGFEGKAGIAGQDGQDGQDAKEGKNGTSGIDGKDGADGKGTAGKDGKDLRDVPQDEKEKEDLEKYYLLWIFVGMGICAICMAIVSLTVVMARLLLPKSKHSRKSTFQSNPIREVDAFAIRVPQVQQRNHTQNRLSHIRVHPSLSMVAVQYEQQ